MKAQEWLERGNQEQDPFNAFSNYWRGFNHLFSGNGRERDLIKAYLRNSIDEQTAADLLNRYSQESQILVNTAVLDMRGNGRSTQRYQSQFSSAVTEINKLIALFMIIYQVRCNLEHGQKSPSRARDRQLCQASCPYIARVIESA
ncbi:hypothetical protein ACFOEW_15440 [Alteromonas oceani]|uniref:Apea-like HEPN domain-containing protein n=1 Tax=Alteromonas oceani TaxID=2071609 RepID=A0ABV7K2M0_9ALTE